jgi:hypothetical protein
MHGLWSCSSQNFSSKELMFPNPVKKLDIYLRKSIDNKIGEIPLI